MTNKFGVNPSTVALGSVVVAFAAGAGAGYLISKKKFEQLADEEIAEFKAEYAERQEAHIIAMETANQNRIEKGDLPTMVEDLGYVPGEQQLPEEVKTTRIFDTAPRVPDWDADAEEEIRKTEAIYILTREEFFTNQFDFEERQLTYYEGDDVLCDNADQMITNVVEQVGTDCLSKFGYGSQADDTVYLQNETLNTVYEITRTDGKYSEIVLGLDDEDANSLRHSSSPKKFRSYHDV
jgi:hypothetical protein